MIAKSSISHLAQFQPQSNITGLTFYTNPNAPQAFQNDALVVLHGGVIAEDRRSEEQFGLVILRLPLDEQTGEPIVEDLEDFAWGWWIFRRTRRFTWQTL